MRKTHSSDELIILFNQTFQRSMNTVLVGGAEEPVYLPASEHSSVHQILFTRDYFASALHEVAHWCLAGAKRRLQVDYGYWYYPEGRNAEHQQLFEQAEVKPQALEAIFSQACNFPFQVSIDSFVEEREVLKQRFETKVEKQIDDFRREGLSARALTFETVLKVWSSS